MLLSVKEPYWVFARFLLMRRVALILSLMILIQLAGPWQGPKMQQARPIPRGAANAREADAPDQLKQELEKLKKAVAALEERLKAQEKQTPARPVQAQPQAPTPARHSRSW